MAVDYRVIAVGSAWTAPLWLERADRPIVIVIPTSVNGTELRVQAAVSSGAAAPGDAWGDVAWQRLPNFYATPFTVWSGGGNTRPVVVGPLQMPLPAIRLFMTSSATVPNTYAIITGRYSG